MKMLVKLIALFMAMMLLASCTTLAQDNKKPSVQEDVTDAPDNDTDPDYDPDKIYNGDYFDYDLSQFIEIPVLSQTVISKSELDEQYRLNLIGALASAGSMKEVGEGEYTELYDVVYIDFSGRPEDESVELDEKTMNGMKSSGYEIMIGSNTFIGAYTHKSDKDLDTKGFEEQMVGMKVGDTADILVTFPDDYHQAVLAGMRTVFTVKIRSCKRVTDISDDLAKLNGYKDAADFEQNVLLLTRRNLAAIKVIEATKIISYPVGDMELLEQYYIDSYVSYYYGGNISNEEIEALLPTLTPEARAWAEGFAKERMTIKHIADICSLAFTEAMLREYAEKEAKNAGLGSADTLIAYYGKDTVWFSMAYEAVLEVIESSVIFES